MSKNPFQRHGLQGCSEGVSSRIDFSTVPEFSAGPDFQSFIAPTPRTLEQAAKAATDRVDGRLLSSFKPWIGSVPRAKALLEHLIRCYARQIYASTDIIDILMRDEAFARLCGDAPLNARDVSNFRSRNRQVIHSCLIAALEFLVAEKISLGVLTKVSNAQLAEEASRRIIMAGFMDSMELDGSPVMDPPAEFSYLFANPGNERHQ